MFKSKGAEKDRRPWVLLEAQAVRNAETAGVNKPDSDGTWAVLALPLGLLLCVCLWQVAHCTICRRNLTGKHKTKLYEACLFKYFYMYVCMNSSAYACMHACVYVCLRIFSLRRSDFVTGSYVVPTLASRMRWKNLARKRDTCVQVVSCMNECM